MIETTWAKTFERLNAIGVTAFTKDGRAEISRLPIAEIVSYPELFQPRQQIETTASHGAHVAELSRALHARKRLDKITVIRVGEEWIVIDGHHRLEAYQQAGGRKTHIPVEVADCTTLDEAQRFSIAANSKDKLPATRESKQEAAYRLVVRGVYSKEEISHTANVAEATVARMRRSLREAREHHPQIEWATRTWVQLKWTLKNGTPDNNDKGNWMMEKAERGARTLSKQFGQTLSEHPDIFNASLALFLGDPAALRATGEWLMRQADRKQGVNQDF